SDLLQMSGAEAAMQNVINLSTQVFCRGNVSFELRAKVQILVVEALQHLSFDKMIEIHKIADHSRARIYLAADGYFKRVVMTVTIGIIALAVRAAIFLLRQLLAVQAVRRRKHIAACEMSFHGSP